MLRKKKKGWSYFLIFFFYFAVLRSNNLRYFLCWKIFPPFYFYYLSSPSSLFNYLNRKITIRFEERRYFSSTNHHHRRKIQSDEATLFKAGPQRFHATTMAHRSLFHPSFSTLLRASLPAPITPDYYTSQCRSLGYPFWIAAAFYCAIEWIASPLKPLNPRY